MHADPAWKDEDVNQEAAEAIRIADKHLAGAPVERRKALAQEIVRAINHYAELIALDAIKIATGTKSH
jgi:hypothetical protein